MTKVLDWVRGDLLGLELPAHETALREGSTNFLTQAFRASGALSDDNSVAAITRLETCSGGSTGRKLWLSIDYEKSDPTLDRDLFVKFSRDFDDPIRAQAQEQLAPEVRLALLSQDAGFPITVPRCYYADYQASSGTGILITQSIPFGQNGIAPLYEKCRDHRIPNALEHYRAVIKALAQLAGAHRSGRLGESIEQHFPYEPSQQSLYQPIRYSQEQLLRRVDKFAAFVDQHARLLPENIVAPCFIEQLRTDIPTLLARENETKHALLSTRELIALVHWNANLDNAWFWRDGASLQCGLMDWGGVGQMNLGLALWGALSAAETALWTEHLDSLLALFIEEFECAGGATLALETLRRHLCLSCAMMSLSWLMDAPAMISRALPELGNIPDRFHPAFEDNESPRVQLQMFSNVMNLWQRYDFAKL